MINYTGHKVEEQKQTLDMDTDLDNIARSAVNSLENYRDKALDGFENIVEDMRADPMSDYDIYDFGDMQPYLTVNFPFNFDGYSFALGIRETYVSDTESLYSVFTVSYPGVVDLSTRQRDGLKSTDAAQDVFLNFLLEITDQLSASENSEENIDSLF